ncbi:glycoside hydrolase family 66 protein [Streptococcus saliviloxodontae]|uniref:Dextranase n=1 Tax=Streptococcus saliviloxodontae TaxID=1349416 RepID=A0ABS2PMJ2_9STRE|nr:glycoside hydrolase family 66 protein [Streptococcus saliviloxodontae]MBM7636652.1 hypothetical protein [Streptococcus saliviloxodontae]
MDTKKQIFSLQKLKCGVVSIAITALLSLNMAQKVNADASLATTTDATTSQQATVTDVVTQVPESTMIASSLRDSETSANQTTTDNDELETPPTTESSLENQDTTVPVSNATVSNSVTEESTVSTQQAPLSSTQAQDWQYQTNRSTNSQNHSLTGNFSKSVYRSGEDAVLTIQQPSDAVKTDVAIYHLNQLIYQTTSYNNAAVNLPSYIFSPNSGYTVSLSSLNQQGNQVDSSTLGLSIEDDWTIYPRYGVVAGSTDYGFSMTRNQLDGYKSSVEKLNQMHINNFFFYNVYHTTSNPFPSGVDSFYQEWASWTNPKIETSLIKDIVKYIQDKGGKAMLYNMFNARSKMNGWVEYLPDYLQSSLLYNASDNNHLGRPNAITQTNFQEFIDPNDPNWQNYIITKMLAALKEGGFNGWQADTIGDALVYKINANGSRTTPFKMAQGYVTLSKTAAKALTSQGYDYLINDINTGQADDLATTGIAVPFSEVWSIPGDDTYADLKRLVDRQKKLTGKSPILAIYTETNLNNKAINKSSELMVDAIVAASGGYHMTVAALNSSQDEAGFGIIQNEYYPNQDWKVTNDVAQSIFNYQQFIVAYEELLRGSDLTETQNIVQIKNKYGWNLTSTRNEANKIYTFTKERSNGDQIFHLLNTYNADHKWHNNNNNPDLLDNLSLLIPLQKGLTQDQAQHFGVFWASPDTDSIMMRSLPVTSITYKNGRYYLSVTVPSIKIWDLIYVTKLANQTSYTNSSVASYLQNKYSISASTSTQLPNQSYQNGTIAPSKSTTQASQAEKLATNLLQTLAKTPSQDKDREDTEKVSNTKLSTSSKSQVKETTNKTVQQIETVKTSMVTLSTICFILVSSLLFRKKQDK